MPLIINLYIEFQDGAKKGEVMSIMCLGINNFLYRMSEMAAMPTTFVIGFEVLG